MSSLTDITQTKILSNEEVEAELDKRLRRLWYEVVGEFLWKWLFCFWAHSKHRCYPTVWGPEVAKELGKPYEPNYWHCTKCHPCNEGIKEMLETLNEIEERKA